MPFGPLLLVLSVTSALPFFISVQIDTWTFGISNLRPQIVVIRAFALDKDTV